MAVSRRQLIGDKVSGLCSGVSIVTGWETVFRVVKDAGRGQGRGWFFFLSYRLHGIVSGVKAIFKGPAGALAVCNKRSQSDSFRPGPSGAHNIGRRGPCHGPPSRRKQLKLGRSLWSLSLR